MKFWDRVIGNKNRKHRSRYCSFEGTEQLQEKRDYMKENNIEPKKILIIYPKEGKSANLLLIEGVKNGKSSLKIMPPLYIHNEDGSYKENIREMFQE